MILYLVSSEKNAQIFDIKCSEYDAQLEKENIFTLSEISRDIINSKYTHINTLIIDISVLSDTDTEIFEYIKTIKFSNTKYKIVIVSKRLAGDMLLASLFNVGVYDFVTIDDEKIDKQIDKVLTNKNNILEVKEYYIDNIVFEEKKEKANIKEKISNIFRNFKRDKKEKKEKKEKKKKKDKKYVKEQDKKEVSDEILDTEIMQEPKKQKLKKMVATEEIQEDIQKYIQKDVQKDVQEDIQREQDIRIRKEIDFETIKKDIVRMIDLKESFLKLEKNEDIETLETIYIHKNDNTINFYGNLIGIVVENKAYIDTNFKNEKIIKFLKNKEIEYCFSEGVYDKIN